MISYWQHDKVDKKKYDLCIAKAVQSKVYAFSWYLDAVTETWDALVLNDYEAVMPLPKRKKWGIGYVYQPYWIQHLGVFSAKNLEENDSELFLNSIPKRIRLIDFNINFKTESVTPKINYILPLQIKYEALFKGFSKLRKRSIAKAKKADLLLKKIDRWAHLLNLPEQNHSGFRMTKEAAYTFENLLKTAVQFNKLKIIAAYSKADVLVGGAFFIISENRITYLFSVLNKKGRDLQAMSLILDFVIKEYSESKYILDFEGSMLSGVAKFIKSFGAEEEAYYHLKKWRLF
ncbi:MAG: hypothetical protein L3J45_01835 [Flavobacteriaceae bacterium]|nr:hypothetical protein [Flavobacteriaceae bacterium]